MENAQHVPPPSIKFMTVNLTVEEAQLILNKLNTCDFNGFTEAGMAIAILGKVRSAPVQDASAPPQKMAESAALGPASMQALTKKFATPPAQEGLRPAPVQEDHIQETEQSGESEVVEETEPPEESSQVEEEAPVEVEDDLPVAPLRSLSEAKDIAEVQKEDDSVPASDATPPPEDAGIFSVIDKTKTGTEKEYV